MREEIYVTRASMPDYHRYSEAIRPLWDSHMLTNMGTYHEAFREQLKEYLHVDGVELVSNGHMGLELTLAALGLGGEILTTPFTFVSTCHAIVRNHLTPVFCDVRKSDGTLDPDRIEEKITERTSAILAVHVYGNICDTAKIEAIARKHHLKVIYDAAHAFGETSTKGPVGSFGDVSVFSFHATKSFNTIEGGAVVSSDRELLQRIRRMSNFGLDGEDVTELGVNAKLNEFQAIMGLCNLEHFRETVERRREVVQMYRQFLKKKPGVRILLSDEQTAMNYTYFPIVLEQRRDVVFERLEQQGIHARKYFYPLVCDLTYYRECYGMAEVPVARNLSERVLTLPVYEDLTREMIEEICELV